MKRPEESSYFTFANPNPKPNLRASDCVIRAIALASGKPWIEVYREMVEIAIENGRMPNEDWVIDRYLWIIGWVKMKCLKNEYGKRLKVKEMVNLDGEMIVRCSGHLTCIINHKIHDTWNCGDYAAGVYYVKR